MDPTTLLAKAIISTTVPQWVPWTQQRWVRSPHYRTAVCYVRDTCTQKAKLQGLAVSVIWWSSHLHCFLQNIRLFKLNAIDLSWSKNGLHPHIHKYQTPPNVISLTVCVRAYVCIQNHVGNLQYITCMTVLYHNLYACIQIVYLNGQKWMLSSIEMCSNSCVYWVGFTLCRHVLGPWYRPTLLGQGVWKKIQPFKVKAVPIV